MILFGLRDMGSGNACLSVVKILKDKGVPVSVYAEGPVYKNFKGDLSFISGVKIDDVFDSVRPSLIVATTAQVGGDVPIGLIKRAKQSKLPVMLVEDVWASHASFKWDVFPDAVCVMDKFAKDLILKSWPDFLESHVYVTGMSGFDKYVDMKTETLVPNLYKILDLTENWPILFFTGQAWGMPQAIKILVEALNNFKQPFYLILADHPSVVSSSAGDDFKKIYLEYRRELHQLKIGKVIDSYGMASSEVMSGADFVVSMYSTMALEACYMRKPVLIIWTPEIGQLLLKVTNNTLCEWPLTRIGAALRAENVVQVKKCLQKILDGDTASMLQAQQTHFRADGLNGVRIAQTILNYYRG